MDHRKAQENAMKDYRAGERNAVAIAQSYEAKQAVQVQRDEEKAAVSIAEEYKAREREKQNAVDAARWAGVATVEQARQAEENKPWWQEAWDNTKTLVQEKIIQPVATFWDENIYKPIIQPTVNWAQENIIQPVKTFWNEKVYKPYIQPVETWVKENIVESVKTVFQQHPKAAWGTAAIVTTATIAGTVYYIDCYGIPGFTPPVSSLINFAGMFSLPITGWLTTSRKQRVYGILVGMLMLGMFLSACGGGTSGNTPVAPPTGNALCPPAPVATEPPTLTPPPSATPNVIKQLNTFHLPNDIYLGFLTGWINEYGLANPNIAQQYGYDQWLLANGYDPTALSDEQKAVLFWQNQFNQHIYDQANIYGIDPNLLKGQMMVESNGAVDPGHDCTVNGETQYCRNYGYVGLMQISSGEIANVLSQAPEDLLAQIVGLYLYTGIYSPLPPKPETVTYSQYYASLSQDQKLDFAEIALRFVDGQCLHSDVDKTKCTEGATVIQEGFTSIQIAAAINAYNREELIRQGYISQANWDRLSVSDQNSIMIAAYNGGLGGIGNAIYNVTIRDGTISWSQVQSELNTGKNAYTISWCQSVVYPQNAACYVSGVGSCVLQPVQNDVNDLDNDGIKNECTP